MKRSVTVLMIKLCFMAALLPVSLRAQRPVAGPIDVKGKVVNEHNEPVAASVAVKGVKRITGTDSSGNFELKQVPANATLLVTGINILAFEVAVKGRSDLSL